MKNAKIFIAGLTAFLATASGAALAEQYVDQARVLSVTPEYDRVSTPRQECYDEYDNGRPYNNRSGDRSYGGAVIGGITGAIVGNQVGGGHGKEAATALGAITGALVGDRMQNRENSETWDTRTAKRCRNIEQWENRIAGYRVAYEYGGRRYAAMMPNNPGNFVRVRVSVDPYEY